MKMDVKYLPILFALAISTLACNITIQTPQVKTGPEIVTSVDEAFPESRETPEIEIRMGAGALTIGEGEKKLIEGKIHTNVPLWEPQIIRSDEKVTISQVESKDAISIPSGDLVNNWDLLIGTEEPISLDIKAGAYKSTIVVGEIQLNELNIEDGASQSSIMFDKPNKTTMDLFRYRTGASQVNLINLSNANFKEMDFESGAGSYTLDFNGELKQDATVSVESGLSNIKIIIPSNINATVALDGGVNNVSLKGTWTVDSNEYHTQSSRGPKLEIDIEMGVGNLELISSNSDSI